MSPVKWYLNALFLTFCLKKNALEEYYDIFSYWVTQTLQQSPYNKSKLKK